MLFRHTPPSRSVLKQGGDPDTPKSTEGGDEGARVFEVQVLPDLSAFCWLGELCLLSSNDIPLRHGVTVQARSFVEARALRREDFDAVLAAMPAAQEEVQKLRREYAKQELSAASVGCGRCQGPHWTEDCRRFTAHDATLFHIVKHH